jgi:hypothetical protein
MNKPFLYVDGGMYQVLRVIKESHKPIVDTWKDHLKADKVFRKDGSYYFVREVSDVEIVEEDNVPEEKNEEPVNDQPQELSSTSS